MSVPHINKNRKRKGFYENADPTCLVKGKPVAPKHHEVAIRESLKDAIRVPMVPMKGHDTPVLPTLSEGGKLIRFNFAIPTSRFQWLKEFASANSLELSHKGTMGHAEIPAAYLPILSPILLQLELEFEEEFKK